VQRTCLLLGSLALFGGFLLQLPLPSLGAVIVAWIAMMSISLFASNDAGSLWSHLPKLENRMAHGEQCFTLIEELEGLGRFVRSNGMVALGRDLHLWNLSHPYLNTALNYCVDAKDEESLNQLLRLQGTANEARFQQILQRFKMGARAFLPITSIVNALGVLLAIKGILPTSWAMSSFLLTAGAYLVQAHTWSPYSHYLEQRLAEEKTIHRMIQHGVRALWRQEHPTSIRQDLEAFMPHVQDTRKTISFV